MKPTKQQSSVLDAMRKGQSFGAAYDAAGLSDYKDNKARFLLRLLEGGFITMTHKEMQ